ncbi:MAG: DUF421 domain-containing protein [Bacilli bacterium]|nr:DUF421 domain-containing protein [Bacilli bacterium]
MLSLVLISRCIISYTFIIVLYSLAKKRKITFLTKITYIFILLLCSNMIINYKYNIIYSIIPIITIIVLYELFVIVYYDHKSLKNYFDSDPIILVKNGKVIFKNLIDNNYSIESLLTELKKKNIYSFNNIKYLFLESDKSLSILSFDDKSSPTPVILDGKINKDVLYNLSLKKSDLYNMLTKEHVKLEDIYYALYKKKKIYIIKNEELK